MNDPFSDKNSNLKQYMLGGMLGLAIGTLAAFLFVRASEENDNQDLHISTIDMIKVAVAVLTIVRQIADLGSKKS